MLHGRIPNIQTSWVKLGTAVPGDAQQRCQRPGWHVDGGDHLAHGGVDARSEKTVAELHAMAAGIGRPLASGPPSTAASIRPGVTRVMPVEPRFRLSRSVTDNLGLKTSAVHRATAQPIADGAE